MKTLSNDSEASTAGWDAVALSECLCIVLERSSLPGLVLGRVHFLRELICYILAVSDAQAVPYWTDCVWSLRASVAKTCCRFPESEFVRPLLKTLQEAVLGSMDDDGMGGGLGSFHILAEKAFTKIAVVWLHLKNAVRLIDSLRQTTLRSCLSLFCLFGLGNPRILV